MKKTLSKNRKYRLTKRFKKGIHWIREEFRHPDPVDTIERAVAFRTVFLLWDAGFHKAAVLAGELLGLEEEDFR